MESVARVQSRRAFLLFVSLLFVDLSIGCSKEKKGSGARKMHWDRDMCERCKMVVSERKFAAQIIAPDGKAYKFDDIGCATLWLEEEKIPWAKEAKIWVTDAKSGKWIDARSALYTDDSITPMAYGIAAYDKSTFPKGHKVLHFDEIVKIIRAIEDKNNKMRGLQ